jgi:hypothetical protein
MPLVVQVLPQLLDPHFEAEDAARILETHPDTRLARTTALKRAAALVGWRRQLDPHDGGSGAQANTGVSRIFRTDC